MNKKGAWSLFRKKVEPVPSKKEVIDLQADLAENFSDLEAKLKAFFNKTKTPLQNKDHNTIKFNKAKIRGLVEKDPLVRVYNHNDPYKRPVLTKYGYIELLFDIFFYEDKKSFKYNTWLLAVDDNGVARWALIYVIKKHDASQKYPRVFNSLAEDGLFFAIKEMVIEHSHRSYLGNNINYKS